MIYTRVYETKILKLADGRIIHFSLQGRNNDNIGTNRNTFTAKIWKNIKTMHTHS